MLNILKVLFNINFLNIIESKESKESNKKQDSKDDKDPSDIEYLDKTPIQSMTFSKSSTDKFIVDLSFLYPIHYQKILLMKKGGGEKDTDYISIKVLDTEVKSLNKGNGMKIELNFSKIEDRGEFSFCIFLASNDGEKKAFFSEGFVYEENMTIPKLARDHKKKTALWVIILLSVLSGLVVLILIVFLIRCLRHRNNSSE